VYFDPDGNAVQDAGNLADASGEAGS